MPKYFTFNNVSSTNYDIYIGGQGTYDAPKRDVTKVSVPGRNGDVLLDNGRFENIKVTYPIIIPDNFSSVSQSVRQWLLSPTDYCTLQDSYHTNEYRLARISGSIDFTTGMFNKYGKAKITFDCKPQRFLLSGLNVTTITSSGTLNNPTKFPSKPYIKAYGSGNFTITINGSTIYLYDVEDYYELDFEKMMCYRGSVNKNNKFTGSFVELQPGNNTISTTGTKLEVQGNWWII